MKDIVYLQVPSEEPSQYKDMPDGLNGYWGETDNLICVQVVFFPTVIHARLDKLLRLRGYQDAVVEAELMDAVIGLAKVT